MFFAPNGTVKVGDFGLATLAARPLEDGNAASLDVTSNVGTRLYMSPEQFDEGVSYTNKVDVYALGMVLAELMVPCHTQMQRVALLESIRAGRPNGDIDSIDHDDVCHLPLWLLYDILYSGAVDWSNDESDSIVTADMPGSPRRRQSPEGYAPTSLHAFVPQRLNCT